MASYTRRINLYINGKEVKNDIASIKSAMGKLVNEQARMTRGSNEYVAAGKKIRALKGIIAEHNDSLRSVSKSWNFENLSNSMNKYFLAVSTFVAGMGSMLYAGKKAITMFAEFDDKVADVMKTADLSKDAVYAMNEQLKKIDTRTAQDELLDLGRIGGKLGLKLEKDVEGFIRASDKVVVALKEDLGDNAEEAVRQVGKLVSVFGVRDEFGIEEAITKTGSAINELGMASTANEGYIVEFTKRLAGVAPGAKISIQNVMALGATLDHFGQTSEVSSTAMSQVITGMFKNTADFAKAARMDVGEFSNLLQTDANEALVRLLEGLNNNDAGMEDLIASLGDLGLEGKRTISVLGVLSKNTAFLREQQKQSNKEFDKGTSLQNEFNIKNNSAQAILEKKRKVLNNLAIDLGQKLMPVLTASTSGFSYFVKAFTVIADFAIRNSGAIITLTASIAAYTIATKIATMWENRRTQATLAQIIVTKSKALIEGIATAATQLYAAATMLLTGNIKGATQAMRVFNSVTKANGIGLLIGLLTAAAGALYYYWQRTKEVANEGLSTTKETIELQKQKLAQIVEEKNELNNLVRQITLSNEKSEIRKTLIADLQKMYPDFLGNLNAEKVTNADIATQLGIVNKAYGEKIRLSALSAKSEAFTKKMVENESRKIDIESELEQKRKTAYTPGTAIDKEIQSLEAEFEKLTRENKGWELSLKKLDEDILKIKSSTFSNTVEWWTKKTKELTFSIDATKRMIKAAKEQNNDVNAEFYANALASYEAEMKIAELQLAAAEKKAKEEAGSDPGGKPPGGDPDKSKWSLNSDINFLRASLKLKQDYASGVIKTEEELNEKLRALEVQTLKDRVNSGKAKGAELLDLQTQLADKYVDIQKERMKREETLQGEINKGLSQIEKERQEFEERLISLKLYGKKREDMTAVELAAIEALEREHQNKLSKLDADAMKEEIERRQRTFDTDLAEMKLQHTNELNAITTLAEAKDILSATMSNEELAKVKSLNKAKKLIQNQSALEEEEFTRRHMTELLEILQSVMGSGDWEGLNLSDSLLSEEEKQLLVDRINEIKKIIAGLKGGEDDNEDLKGLPGGMSTDILGFSQNDWELMFKNLESGKAGIGELLMGVKALGEVWKTYYDYINAKETAQFEKYEAGVNKQKETLQKSLDDKLISQEAYDYQLEQLDQGLDAKKRILERKQAQRTRNIAIMEAIVNTASAVTSALKVPPPLGIALAAIVGAMGMFQIGKIVNTSVPGMEAGGFLDVQREQDGKRFRAKNQPGKRGYVSSPTVITGEKSGFSEYIVPDQGVSNPTVKPVLDILEMARMNGTLSTINLPAILDSTRTYPGRQQGGYISDVAISASKNSGNASSSNEAILLSIIQQNTVAMNKLNTRLEKPIESKVALHGRGGLYEMMDEDSLLKDNANF